LQMTQERITVYTLPGCSHCEALKSWLRNNQIDFTERLYVDDAQVDLIMRNVFSDPPVLEVDSRIYTPDDLFQAEALDEETLREAVHEEAKE